MQVERDVRKKQKMKLVAAGMFLVLAACPSAVGMMAANGWHLAAYALAFAYAVGFGALAMVASDAFSKSKENEVPPFKKFKFQHRIPTRDGKHAFVICSDSKLSFWTREQVDNDPFKHYFYVQTLRFDSTGMEQYSQFSMLESTTGHMFTIGDDDYDAKIYVYYPYEHKPAVMQLAWWTDTYNGLCDEHAVEMPGFVELSPKSKYVESPSYYDDVEEK